MNERMGNFERSARERSEAYFILKQQEHQIDSFYRRLALSLNNDPEHGIDYDWKLPEGYEGEGLYVPIYSVISALVLSRDGELVQQYSINQGSGKYRVDMQIKRGNLKRVEIAVARKRDEMYRSPYPPAQ